MHYKVQGHVLRTENTAKPRVQSSRYLREWLLRQPPVEQALDFGCGKLRYSAEVAARSRLFTLVDSEEQIARLQLLDGERATIREYVRRHWRHGIVLSTTEFARSARRYDFVLCANVLPVIPDRKARANALRLLAGRLTRGERCLFVAQYRNSYFAMIQKLANARPHLDGWLVPREENATSYFGILPPSRLERLVTAHGFTILHSWVEEQSAYVLCASHND